MKKYNVIFVNPSLGYDDQEFTEVVFPFAAILLLATILEKKGYNVKIIDGNRYTFQECLKKIFEEVNEYTLYIGFSVMTSQMSWVYRITKEIKKAFPEIHTIWGGAHPTLYPEQTIADEAVDVVVYNEACATIGELTETIKNSDDLSKVPGIYFKKKEEIIKTSAYIPDDIKKIPFINFSLIDINYYSHGEMLSQSYNLSLKKVVSMSIITGLGCAYKCTFCINVILHRRYRYKSAEEVVDRIEYLQNEYGANFFQFLDEDFFINKKRVLKFIELVEKRNLKFYFRPWLRVSYFKDSYLTADIVQRLQKIGMITAVMGAESGSQDVLDRIKKQIKVEDTIRAAKTLAKTNILPRYSFMVGLPGETGEEILATYRLALKLHEIDKRSDITILSFASYPGSPIYDEAVKKYNLQEPASLSEWSKVDFSGYLGFYSVQSKPWIKNKIIFERMNYYYNLGYRFSPTGGNISELLHWVLKKTIAIRFKLGWFEVPVEEYLLNSYRRLRGINFKNKLLTDVET